MLKLGERSAKLKAREFHLERNRSGASSIVYKSYKMLASQSDATIDLCGNFFVKPVRTATEQETVMAHTFATENTVFNDLLAKRCFDIDFFEPNFPPAVGPTWTRSITVFATPDSSIADLWGYMSSLMIDQGVFAPSPDDPDQFMVANVVVVGIQSTPPTRAVIVPIPSPCSKQHKCNRTLSTVDADILLSSLPLPPAVEYVDVSNEVSDADEHASINP